MVRLPVGTVGRDPSVQLKGVPRLLGAVTPGARIHHEQVKGPVPPANDFVVLRITEPPTCVSFAERATSGAPRSGLMVMVVVFWAVPSDPAFSRTQIVVLKYSLGVV